MKTIMKRLALLVMILMLVVGVSGCETMKGLGKDISDLGDKIEDKASK
ncbi:entericidin A/B family lipoprotein [Kaarinaea lacus]